MPIITFQIAGDTQVPHYKGEKNVLQKLKTLPILRKYILVLRIINDSYTCKKKWNGDEKSTNRASSSCCCLLKVFFGSGNKICQIKEISICRELTTYEHDRKSE